MKWLYPALGAPILLIAASCSPVGKPTVFGDGGGGDSTSGAGGAGGTSLTTSASTGDITVGSGVGGGGGGSSGSGGNQIAEVYGHSPSELYRLDPNTKQVTTIGAFNGCSSVIDIAIDKNSNMYGTTFDGLYKIDKATAACSFIASGSYPNSLSFVPEGTLDPNVEALVGYNGSEYVRIDPAGGAVQTIGSIGGGYISSGDIVSVKGGKTYLTVKGNNCSDCIIEVNPATGAVIKNYGNLGYGSVFGLAFWAGTAYGFSDYGELFEIQFSQNAVTTKLISIPGSPAGLEFWGAGSTTSAPPDPIPQ